MISSFRAVVAGVNMALCDRVSLTSTSQGRISSVACISMYFFMFRCHFMRVV